MGYFPNGASGLDYQERYCFRCVHWPDDPADGGCNVWLAHILHNGDEILNKLIPRSADGLINKQCTMFLSRAGGGTEQ